MNRIDTTQTAYEMSRALAEMTGGEVTSLTMGRVHSTEDGGMTRQIRAGINGERKNFVATEKGGHVSIHEGTLGLRTDNALKASGWPVRGNSQPHSTTNARVAMRRR